MNVAAERLRLGFLGAGWIGRHRMHALLEDGLATTVALVDPDHDSVEAVRAMCGEVTCLDSFDALLEVPLDGVVISTPSAGHAQQVTRALERSIPVFCQKPLGLHRAEVAAVVTTAARVDRLLGVDLCYRHLAGMLAARDRIGAGALGRIHAVQAVFHNAYGPDKEWFYRRDLSGGGCVIDLGIHLVDLALWLLGDPAVTGVRARCYSHGLPLREVPDAVEDYASAQITLAGQVHMDLCCSWNLPIDADAEIGMRIFGTDGSICLRNIGGSFYDFVVEHVRGRQPEVLGQPPDAWGGRAIGAWARQLALGASFDPATERLVKVAGVLDDIYSDAVGAD